jgi:hypothetical protein
MLKRFEMSENVASFFESKNLLSIGCLRLCHASARSTDSRYSIVDGNKAIVDKIRHVFCLLPFVQVYTKSQCVPRK